MAFYGRILCRCHHLEKIMTFAEKLNHLVALTGTTNAKVSRGVRIDPSMVSKWRKGVRNPSNNLEMVMALADYFAARISVEYQRETLAALIGEALPPAQNKAGLRDAIFTWLMAGSLAVEAAPPAAGLKEAAPRRYQAQVSAYEYKYVGHNGREKVLKACVSELDRHEGKINLIIYFDEPADWVDFTAEYLSRLARTQPRAFEKVEQVRVLVPTELLAEEMLGVFKMCMPFARHAAISIYHLPGLRNGLLQHLLIAARDFNALTSLGVYGGPYTSTIMHKDPSYVNSIVDALYERIATSQQLMEAHQHPHLWEYLDSVGEMFGQNGDVIGMGYLMLPFLLPAEVLWQMAEQAEEPAPEGGRERLHRMLETDLPAFLAGNRLYCNLPLLLPGEVAAGAVALPHQALWGERAAITPAIYLQMLKNVERLNNTYENFRFTGGASGEHPFVVMLVQDRQVVMATQNEPRPRHYSSRQPSVAAACYNAVRELKKDDFTPARQAEARHTLAAHIAQYEAQMQP